MDATRSNVCYLRFGLQFRWTRSLLVEVLNLGYDSLLFLKIFFQFPFLFRRKLHFCELHLLLKFAPIFIFCRLKLIKLLFCHVGEHVRRLHVPSFRSCWRIVLSSLARQQAQLLILGIGFMLRRLNLLVLVPPYSQSDDFITFF